MQLQGSMLTTLMLLLYYHTTYKLIDMVAILQVLTMQWGRYGNLTAAALKRSQFISPGLLRQQQVREPTQTLVVTQQSTTV